jgi:hypothetical protein
MGDGERSVGGGRGVVVIVLAAMSRSEGWTVVSINNDWATVF